MVDGAYGNYCSYTVTPLTRVLTPSISSVTSNTICSGTTNTLTLKNTAGTSTYTWTASSPSAITGSIKNSFIITTPTINTTYTVDVNQLNGCPLTTYTHSLFVNPTPVFTAGTATVCSGVALNYNLTASQNSTFSWRAFNNINTTGESTSSVNSATINDVIVNTSGTVQLVNYSVTPTSTLGNCVGATKIVTVTVNPTPTITVNSPTVCSGSSAVLTATSSPFGSTTYSWSPSTFLNDSTGATVTSTTPTITSVYLITGTLNGCTSSKSSTVTVKPTPTITIASVSSSVICSGNTTTITPSGASTYTLLSGPKIGTSFTVSPTITTTYSIVGTNSLSCPSSNTAITTIVVNPTPTLSILSVSSPTICNGSSTIITPTAVPTGAASYTLNPGNLIGTSFTVSPSSTTTYSIVGMSIDNCPSSNMPTTKITVNAIPISTASTTGSITCVNNSINLNSTLSGVSYTWTAPAGSSITGSPFTQNTTGQGLGTYTLNLMSKGCTYSTTIAANQNTTTPASVTAGATQSLICGVPTVTLAGSATPTTATANWLGGVTNPTSFTTTTGSAGTYTLQAVDPITGCSIESTVSVTQSIDLPVVTANPVTFSITCANTMVPIGVVVSSTNAVTYQWSATGISGSTANSTATATLAGVYNVTVTNTGNNCTTIKSITVPTDITPVAASITPAATITCSVPTLTLNAVPGGANYTYTWTGTSAIVSGSLTQNPIVDNGGTYSVAITNTVNGCVGYATFTVASNTVLPVVNIAAPSVTTTCKNPTVTLVVVSTPSTGVTYSWTAPATGTLSSYTISNPIASGSGIFTVVVTNIVSGCSSALTQNTIVVIPDFAVPTTTLSASSVSITCSNPTPSVSITTTVSPVSYSWTPTIGIVAGTGNTANPSFSLAGTYSAVVTNNINGCSTNTSDNVVTVNLNITVPTVTLSIAATNTDTLTCTKLSVVVTPTINPSVANYTWTSSTGIISTQSVVTLTSSGIYTITVVNPINGCVTSNIAKSI